MKYKNIITNDNSYIINIHTVQWKACLFIINIFRTFITDCLWGMGGNNLNGTYSVSRKYLIWNLALGVECDHLNSGVSLVATLKWRPSQCLSEKMLKHNKNHSVVIPCNDCCKQRSKFVISHKSIYYISKQLKCFMHTPYKVLNPSLYVISINATSDNKLILI